jgi:hypothetical protein
LDQGGSVKYTIPRHIEANELRPVERVLSLMILAERDDQVRLARIRDLLRYSAQEWAKEVGISAEAGA